MLSESGSISPPIVFGLVLIFQKIYQKTSLWLIASSHPLISQRCTKVDRFVDRTEILKSILVFGVKKGSIFIVHSILFSTELSALDHRQQILSQEITLISISSFHECRTVAPDIFPRLSLVSLRQIVQTDNDRLLNPLSQKGSPPTGLNC